MGWIEEILNKVGIGILFIDTDHRVQWANSTACKWFSLEIGKKRRCYRTMEYGETFCMMCPTRRAVDFGSPVRYEFPVTYGGKGKLYEVIGLPIRTEKGWLSGAVELVFDVSDREGEKRKVNELMMQIEKMAAMGQLAAGIAHELNTPLATISIISEELREILGNRCEGEALKEYLDDMEGEIRRCRSIIDDLLCFGKKERGNLTEVDINSLISKSMGLVNTGKTRSHVCITLRLLPSLPKVLTNPERFRQVLINVIKNGIEALEGRKDAHLTITTTCRDGLVEIVVEDNGPGIKEKDLNRVFEPFFTTKPVGKGTGLGLSVSYWLMRDLGGDIRIESSEGKGTRVYLSLPLRQEGCEGTHHRR